MFLADKFPHFYKHLIPEVLDLEVPTESFADCSNCHLASTDKKSQSLTKCCTYHANMPNYMVGALLSDDSPEWQEGKKRILDKIDNQIGVTPYGIISPLKFQELKQQRMQEGRMDVLPFEVREQLTCPYLEKGRCTVWKYRSELCITYFCNSVGAGKGKNFWGHLFQYVRAIETKLSLYALKEVGYKGRITLSQIDPSTHNLENKDGSVNERLYKSLWGSHIGKEAGIYKACHEVIAALTPEKTREILGWEIAWLENNFRESLEIFKADLLPLLAKYDDNNIVKKVEEGKYNITSSKGRTITLGTRGLMALKSFDGTKNLQDIQRDSHQLLPMNHRKYKFFLEAGVLEAVTETV